MTNPLDALDVAFKTPEMPPRAILWSKLGLLLGLIFPLCSQSDVVAYSNEVINGTINGWTISASTEVSNSFTISGATSHGSDSSETWAQAGWTPDQVDWSIGTTAFGSEISSGISSTTHSVFSTHHTGDGYVLKIYFLATLKADSHFFSFYRASTNPADSPAFWDQNHGPSTGSSKSEISITAIGVRSKGVIQLQLPCPSLRHIWQSSNADYAIWAVPATAGPSGSWPETN